MRGRWWMHALLLVVTGVVVANVAIGAPFDNSDYYFAPVTSAPTGVYYRSVGLSPDGTRLIAQKSWTEGTQNRIEIVLTDANGQNEVVISAGNSSEGDIYGYQVPFWSDDGSVVGFVEVHNSAANRVLKYDVTTGISSVVYEPVVGDVCNPDFVGSSTEQIVFWQYGPVGGADLFIWDGTSATNITNTPDYKEYEPVSNGDGSVILYWSGETTAEPINTTHTLTYSGIVWVQDLGFTPIPDTYWPYWTGRADNLIGLTRMSTKDVELYDATGALVMDLTGPGYEGGSGQWNFFGFAGEGPYGEFVITSNALRGVLAGRDILFAAPRAHVFVDGSSGSDAYPGTWQAPFATISKGVIVANPGGTVTVAPGAYVEHVNLNKPLTLTGAIGVVLNGGGSGDVVGVSANGVIVQGLEILGGGSGISGETDNSQFINDKIHDNVNVPGYTGVGILLWGDNDNNQIIGNMIYNNDRQGIFIGYQDKTKISTGNLIEGNTIYNNGKNTTNNAPDDSAYGIQLWYADLNAIRSNEVYGHDDWFVAPSYDFAQGIYLISAFGSNVTLNVLRDNNYGLCQWNTYDTSRSGPINVLHWNSIAGNTGYGIRNVDGGSAYAIDASLNWWGSATGPTNSANPGGTGDKVTANVIYSPWVGINPDADPNTPGVQLVSPMLIIVAPVGPEPAGGYFNAAVGGANELPGADTIQVQHGTYNAETLIKGSTEIVSQPGSAAHTTLTGNLSLNAAGIRLGRPGLGFSVLGNITAGAGIDASTIHINWNNLYANVINNGNGTLDALYNFWGTRDPLVIDGRTIGDVGFDPFLPMEADASWAEIQVLLAAGFSLNLDAALDALNQFAGSGMHAQDYMAWVEGQAAEHAAEAFNAVNPLLVLEPAGGGGGAAGGGGTYQQGDMIDLAFTVVNPATGEPVTDLLVTLSVVQLDADGTRALSFWGLMSYNPATGSYALSYDTSALAPGEYDFIITLPDGQSTTMHVVITA